MFQECLKVIWKVFEWCLNDQNVFTSFVDDGVQRIFRRYLQEIGNYLESSRTRYFLQSICGLKCLERVCKVTRGVFVVYVMGLAGVQKSSDFQGPCS